MKHAFRAIAAQNRSGLRGSGRFNVSRRALLQPLMRPGLLVVLDELRQHVLQMPAPEDQQMVEDLAPGCPNPPLGVCVRRGRPVGPGTLAARAAGWRPWRRSTLRTVPWQQW